MSRIIVAPAFVVILILAILVWTGAFGLRVTDLTTAAPTFDKAIASALSDYQTNNAAAASAPQQQVVNGWVARDLLNVIAAQESAGLRTQNDEEALLVLLIVAVALFGATSAFRRVVVLAPAAGPDAPSNASTT